MKALDKRLAALEGSSGVGFIPWCRVIARDGEDDAAAVARHQAAGECRPHGGHFVRRFVRPHQHGELPA